MKAAIILLLCGLGVVYPACEPGWTEYKEDCIWFSNTAKTWIDAEFDCRKKNSWLLSDDSEDKHDFLSNILYAFRVFRFNHYFIGGSDITFENQWRWLETGHNVGPFSRWGMGEPDGNNSKNCLSLKFENDRDLVWSDENCGSHSDHQHGNRSNVHGAEYYICEKPLLNTNGPNVVGR